PNRLGLHARPAARIVTALGPFVADVQLARGERVVSARSVNRIATLAVRGGETITFRAAGADAEQALKALADLAAENFGDLPDAIRSSGKTGAEGPGGPDGQGRAGVAGVPAAKGGVPASPGIAVGPAVWHRPAFDAPPPDLATGDPDSETARLDGALDAARKELAALERRTAAMAGKQEAEIFVMHRLLLDDATIAGDARQRIAELREPAETAWYAVIDQAAESFRQLPEGYMRERAADLVDVGARVLRLLTGAPPSGPRLERPSVLLAADLGPSDMAHLDPALVLGIVTAQGGATSHAAILARSMGIPAVAGAGALAA
ncbi:HPr family phosphocarrier protein, partial [Desulfovibrio sp. DS-1]